eukprot:gnl/Dysnectes_brevis/1372_a1542_2459.p1 GENE.gnl/Dysnectes_brevis/1372_a1542_2459~~gnl/Dysnectes_brevis/1372_a1542_2459.p1  ORF type:complete len:471 (-),score=59.29 gnl/Dysnectes_brevis/1372_a1542_2459:40-1452(-)
MYQTILLAISVLVALLHTAFSLIRYFCYRYIKAPLFRISRKFRSSDNSIGIFHPHAANRGGGERVLWCCISSLQRNFPHNKVVLFSGDDMTSEDYQKQAFACFGIKLEPFEVVRIKNRHKLDPSCYPRLTIIRQLLAPVPLMYNAVASRAVRAIVDTMGVPFAFPLARAMGAAVVSYTHYPPISTDMIERVEQREGGITNTQAITRSGLLTKAKAAYYKMLWRVYRNAMRNTWTAGNSSWTCGHLTRLKAVLAAPLARIYPPCPTDHLRHLAVEREGKLVLSIGQFRPEKDHIRQIRVFAELHRLHGSARLVCVGSVRDEGDAQRLAAAQAEAVRLEVDDSVEFKANIPYKDLIALLGQAKIGLHTMVAEHFGISIVEFQAAGVIPVTHMSGGPLMDIVLGRLGRCCETDEDFVSAMDEILSMDDHAFRELQTECRAHSMTFSEESFERAFAEFIRPVLNEDGITHIHHE